MNFSKAIAFTVALALGAGSTAPVHAKKKPKPATQIKFATLAPEGSTWMKTMRAIDDELRAATDNRIGFKFYPGGVQGDEKDVLRKIRSGQLHSGGFTGNGLGALVPDIRVLELPFMFESLDELDALRNQTKAEWIAKYDEAGYVLLGWADVGFIHLFSTKPIANANDMNAVKMWVWSGDPLAEVFFKSFDVAAVPLAAPDVLTSLQTGIIDAVYASPLAAVALQWFTRVKFMTDVPITHGLGAVLVSKRALGKVSAEDLETLQNISWEQLRKLTETTRRQNLEAIEEMKKENIQVVTVSEADRSAFLTTGRDAWQMGVGKLYSQELLDRMQSLLSQQRADS